MANINIPSKASFLRIIAVFSIYENTNVRQDAMRPRHRRLWQQNSPIAPYSGSSDDESPSDQSDADESNYSNGSVGSNFVPASVISQQNTNITNSPSPVEEDIVIQSLENPQQDTIIQSIESPQQEDTIIKSESPQQEKTIIKSESPRQENTIIKSESPEPSAVLKSLQISPIDIPPEESILPSPPHPIKSESQIDDIIMADAALQPKAEPLSDASSHTLSRNSPSHTPEYSSEPLSDDEVTDRCYGFLLLHYPETLPAALDTISVLLIYQRRPHGLHPYWGFPKGHSEPEDHSDWESASRELLEETGLSPERVKPITPSGFSPPLPDSVAGLRPDFMSIISQYPSLDGGIKEVTYFLARVVELEQLTEQVEELVECRWVKLSEARRLVDTKPVRRVLEKLIGLVSSGPRKVIAKSDWIRWKEVDALDDNGMPRQWRTVGFCAPE